MSRILLADDSPHAQRMGERILREEGFEVVSVTDGRTAMMRLPDVDPDVVFADVSLPGISGYEMCRGIKADPRRRHVRVVLTAGLLEDFDEPLAADVKSDGVLKKPFEASVVVSLIKPMVEAAQREREDLPAVDGPTEEPASATVLASSIEPDTAAGSMPAPAPAELTVVHPVAEAVRARFKLDRQPAWPSDRGTAPVPVRVVQDGPELRDATGRVDPEKVRAAVTIALDAAMPGMIEKITEQVLIALGD